MPSDQHAGAGNRTQYFTGRTIRRSARIHGQDLGDPTGNSAAAAPCRSREPGVQRPLTLVSAPAGFGKTMLLESWAALYHGPAVVRRIALDVTSDQPAACWSPSRRPQRIDPVRRPCCSRRRPAWRPLRPTTCEHDAGARGGLRRPHDDAGVRAEPPSPHPRQRRTGPGRPGDADRTRRSPCTSTGWRAPLPRSGPPSWPSRPTRPRR